MPMYHRVHHCVYYYVYYYAIQCILLYTLSNSVHISISAYPHILGIHRYLISEVSSDVAAIHQAI